MRVEGLEETRNAYTKAKEEEQRQEQGDQIDLQFSFPDSQTACHRFPAGATIAFVKMIIEQNHSVESAKQVLKLGRKPSLTLYPYGITFHPEVKPRLMFS